MFERLHPLWLIPFCVGYFLAAGMAINVAYHRVLSHRSLTLNRWLERAFVTLGIPAGTPIQWAGNHRWHHGHTDVEGDPHSPVRDGFWWAHVGWYIGTRNPVICFLYSIAGPLRVLYDGWNRPRTNQQYNHLAKDVAADPWYRFVSRPGPYLVLCILHVVVPLGGAWLLFGPVGVAAAWIMLVLIFNLGDAIDSVTHLWGERPYAEVHQARNNLFMGFATLGEGWHANHHSFPASARHGLLPGQFDFTWCVLRLFERLGLAKDLRVPSQAEIEARMHSPAPSSPIRVSLPQ
ncbi:acyl-CoA desaturase [Hyalangium rubrum]|uniref:Fatty acid desaturase n=1 Tax=Hyalangium rubrum TaxID=3103134 RepID=A0ABU5H105_9BACT|nr:fatty acid desaturase [Hyalangium sp. s54d21]MDY7226438.1 fatty acid desaturase [Hyalangium sp. s54d21]